MNTDVIHDVNRQNTTQSRMTHQVVGELRAIYTLCPKKTCDYIFYNNFNNRCPITIILA